MLLRIQHRGRRCSSAVNPAVATESTAAGDAAQHGEQVSMQRHCEEHRFRDFCMCQCLITAAAVAGPAEHTTRPHSPEVAVTIRQLRFLKSQMVGTAPGLRPDLRGPPKGDSRGSGCQLRVVQPRDDLHKTAGTRPVGCRVSCSRQCCKPRKSQLTDAVHRSRDCCIISQIGSVSCWQWPSESSLLAGSRLWGKENAAHLNGCAA